MAAPPGSSYEICPVCFWEDDGVQQDDPDHAGGADRPSLTEARLHFARFGAVEERLVGSVRPPTREEQAT